MLTDANKQIESTIREIKESQADKERTRIAREQFALAKEVLSSDTDAETDLKIAQKMEQIRKRRERRAEKAALRNKAAPSSPPKDKPTPEHPLATGDKVRIKGGDIMGEIIRIEGKKAAIGFGQMVTTAPMEKLERLSVHEYRAAQHPTPPPTAQQTFGLSERRLHFKPSIDLRGMRLDDALDAVSRFVDDALMVGMDEVSILHGKGNGVLREEIRKYLRTVGGIVSFGDEHVERGGAGITMIHFS